MASQFDSTHEDGDELQYQQQNLRILEYFTNLSAGVELLDNVLEDLNAREPFRFGFIHTAFEDFKSELNHRQGFKPCPSPRQADFNDINFLVALLLFRQGMNAGPKDDKSHQLDLYKTFHEFVQSTVYELLNVFDIETPQEHGLLSGANFDEILSDLHEKSKKAGLRELKRGEELGKAGNGWSTDYQYPQPPIHSSYGRVRILQIFPGADSEIQCSLEECNLFNGGIELALSYVWGKGQLNREITVNGRPFQVTEHLYTILHTLRAQDYRQIWIDAICINQADNREKTHQVRLMRDIYSNAKGTIIWLNNDQVPDRIPASMYDDDDERSKDVDAPLPEGFGGIPIDQYDLVAILTELQEYASQTPGKKIALYVMLSRRVRAILLHEWWERIWTIQEAALPERPPIFFFQGYRFSFDEFILAIKFLSEMEDSILQAIGKVLDGTEPKSGPGSPVLTLVSQLHLLVLKRPPFLVLLRPGPMQQRDREHDIFANYLYLTDIYKSTNPRDKIFALESLLPKCTGRLINVNYNEPYEETFTRASARLFNQGCFISIARFKLLIESQTELDDTTTPSWVLDLRYCDSHNRDSTEPQLATNPVTFDGLLHQKTWSHPTNKLGLGEIWATPSILFCTGVYIDTVYETGPIPDLSHDPDNPNNLTQFVNFTRDRYRCMLDLSGVKSTQDLFESLFRLFTMMTDEKSLQRWPGSHEIFKYRLQEVSWKGISYFVTKRGLAGMATTAMQVGDWLCAMPNLPVYLILREVPDSDKHRIIARATVHDKLIDMDALLDKCSHDIRKFQIV